MLNGGNKRVAPREVSPEGRLQLRVVERAQEV